MEKKNDVMSFFDELKNEDAEYKKYSETWNALFSFINDYEHLKGLGRLTQTDVAREMGTTQSVVSRFERLKGKPTYEMLRKLSSAVNGQLYLTPLGDVTVTLPYDLHDTARNLAAEENKSVQDLLQDILREKLDGLTNSMQPSVYLKETSVEMDSYLSNNETLEEKEMISPKETNILPFDEDLAA